MLRENFEHGPCRRSALSSSNIVDLSAANRSLGEVLTLQLLGGHDRRACREPDMTGLDASTWAERAAETVRTLYYLVQVLFSYRMWHAAQYWVQQWLLGVMAYLPPAVLTAAEK
uniref:Uncharacterized protein n=1 Tax=Timema shepardi TaxID=629360 RepID=A0A7R9B9H9_TIMSH|nr:unnamed protein product [Timema shepardi]